MPVEMESLERGCARVHKYLAGQALLFALLAPGGVLAPQHVSVFHSLGPAGAAFAFSRGEVAKSLVRVVRAGVRV
jgi:hypothetical protein